MNKTDAAWVVGRATIGTAVKLAAPLRAYGTERVPTTGGLVVAANHFSWIDPPALGAMSLAFGVWYAAAAWSLAPYPF